MAIAKIVASRLFRHGYDVLTVTARSDHSPVTVDVVNEYQNFIAHGVPTSAGILTTNKKKMINLKVDANEGGHNQLQWAKVRKRAILKQTTTDDWENASDFQRQVIHQIELAIISVTDEPCNDMEIGTPRTENS